MVDAIAHPGRTFHQTQELIQTVVHLPDYCYHYSDACTTAALAGLFITMDYVHRFETGQLHLSDKQAGILEGAAIEIVLPGPEDTVLDLAKLSSKVDDALDAVDSPISSSTSKIKGGYQSAEFDVQVERSVPREQAPWYDAIPRSEKGDVGPGGLCGSRDESNPRATWTSRRISNSKRKWRAHYRSRRGGGFRPIHGFYDS